MLADQFEVLAGAIGGLAQPFDDLLCRFAKLPALGGRGGFDGGQLLRAG